MMARGRLAVLRYPRRFPLWVVLASLLSIGLCTTMADLIALPKRETLLANIHGQRAVIDAVSGTVALTTGDTESPLFDVGSGAEPPATTASTASDTNASLATLPDGLPKLRTQPIDIKIPAATRDHESLVTAPAPEISEIQGTNILPRRGDHQTLPSTLYARRFTRAPKQQLVAFVVLNAGLDVQSMPLLMGLPPQVSIAFSPYARQPKDAITALRNGGHEVWTMLPVVDTHYPQNDPGPLGLTISQSKDEILARMHQAMAAIVGSVGFVIPPDEAFSSHTELFSMVMEEITSRGLYVLVPASTRSLKQFALSREEMDVTRRTDLLIDAEGGAGQMESKLAGLAALAEGKSDTVIAVMATPQTLAILQKWFAGNPIGDKVTLAPLSGIYQPSEKPAAPAAKEKPASEPATKPEATDDKHAPKTDAKEESKPAEKSVAEPDAKKTESH